MATVQIRSIAEPFDQADPDVIRGTLDTIMLADAMGLLTATEIVGRLDLATLRRVAHAVSEAGIGSTAVVALSGKRLGTEDLREAVENLREALEQSPVPESEWQSLLNLLGTELLAELTAISPASLRRYSSGSRPTPDDVAARIHFLARVVADLKGAYNEIGVRRWFERKRSLLQGRSPAQVLRRKWDPESPGPQRVLGIARSLASSPAT